MYVVGWQRAAHAVSKLVLRYQKPTRGVECNCIQICLVIIVDSCKNLLLTTLYGPTLQDTYFHTLIGSR